MAGVLLNDCLPNQQHAIVLLGAQGLCTSMKRHKLDVNAVGAGTECGIVMDDGRFSDFLQGDVLQFVTSITQKR